MTNIEKKAYDYATDRQKDPNFPAYNWETEITYAYEQGYRDAIDKACDAYCRLCGTKECGDTGECEWVEKFRKRLMR